MKTLIVKLGALGDVVRTTALLRELEGEIYWLTQQNAKDLLQSSKIKKIYSFEDKEEMGRLKEEEFDLIISLDEERDVLELVRELRTKKLIGVFLNNENEFDYTSTSSQWFDMSFASSKFGKERADELKLLNKKSVPQMLIEMIGGRWNGQEYDLGLEEKKVNEKIVGLVNVANGKWPNKGWKGYEKLAELLKAEGYGVVFLDMKSSLKEHIEEINSCSVVVCGDTLGMHIALALKKKVICLFNCTPPQEIYDYGRMIKIVSPLINKYMYKRSFDKEAIEAISVEEVYDSMKNFSKKVEFRFVVPQF